MDRKGLIEKLPLTKDQVRVLVADIVYSWDDGSLVKRVVIAHLVYNPPNNYSREWEAVYLSPTGCPVYSNSKSIDNCYFYHEKAIAEANERLSPFLLAHTN